jgi:aldose sugar dehydrogenase
MEGVEAGGRLAHLIGTQIIWSSGAYGRDDKYTGDPGDTLAQNDATDYGKLLLVDIASGEITKIAKGLRNPQGLSVDPDGGIWVTDHGMRGGDELNYTTVWRRPNFGHPVVSYGTHYDRRSVSLSGSHAGHDSFDLPVVSFVPAIGPGAALFLDGFDPAWDGDVLIGGFKGMLHRVHTVDERAIVVEPIKTGVRTRDIQAMPDGRFAVCTDNLQIIYFSANTSPDAISQMRRQLDGIKNAGQREATAGLFEACLNCHGFETEGHQSGPSLHQICGANVASSSFEDYSSALKDAGGVWTHDRLASFISDPASVAPGTSMAWEGLDDKTAADNLALIMCWTRY